MPSSGYEILDTPGLTPANPPASGQPMSTGYEMVDPFATAGGTPPAPTVPPAPAAETADSVRQSASGDPWYWNNATPEQAALLMAEGDKKGALQKVGEFAGGVPAGLKGIWDQLVAAHQELKGVPFPTSRQEWERLSNTVTEAGAEGALNTWGLAKRAGLNLWDLAKEHLPGATPAQRAADYLQELRLKQATERAARGLPDQRPDNFDPNAPSFVLKNYGDAPPYPQAAQVGSLALDPSFMVGGGVAKLAGRALAGVPGVARAAELVQAAKALPGRAAVGALKGIEKAGAGIKSLAAAPGEMAENAVGGLVSPAMKDAGHNLGVLGAAFGLAHGGPVGSAIAALSGAKLLGQAAADTAEFFRRVAEANGDSMVTRLQQVAASPNAPEWMQIAAGKLDRLKVGSALQFAGDMAESGAHGAATGAGLAVAAGEDPQEAGRMAGAGLGLGLAGRASAKFTGADAAGRRVLATVGARQRLANWLIADPKLGGMGLPVEKLAGVSNFAAGVLGHARDMLGSALKVQFLEPGEAVPGAEPGAAAGFDPATGTISLRLGDRSVRELHELPHAIAFFMGADNEARQVINRVFTPDQINARALEYAGRMVGPELRQRNEAILAQAETAAKAAEQAGNPAEAARLRTEAKDQTVTTPEALRGLTAQKVQAYNDGKRGPRWIYDEIYAEAAFGTFLKAAQRGGGASFMQDLAGVNRSLWQRLGDRARGGFLNTLGDFFDPETGKPAAPRGAIFSDPEVYNSPEMRKLVQEHLRRLARQGAVVSGGGDETPGVGLPVSQVGKHKDLPRQMLVENGVVAVHPKTGEAVTSPREMRRLDREKGRQVKDQIVNQPVRPVGDISPEVAPRLNAEGKTEVTGTRLSAQLAKLPAYGEWARKVVAMAEGLITAGKGGVMRVVYFPVGTSETGNWAKSVARSRGDLPAKEIELAPFLFSIDSKQHALITGLGVTAATRKALRWLQEGRLKVWGDDLARFHADLMTYLQNHANNRPGAEGLDNQRRDLLNAFVAGRQIRMKDYNPLREALHGADRNGIVRSLRVDRISSHEVSPTEGWQAEWAKKKINASPEVEPGAHDEGWEKDFPRVAVNGDLRRLKGQPDYEAGKRQGDYWAAMRAVRAVLQPAMFRELKQRFPDAMLAPVRGREGEATNMLPTAFARQLGRAMGWTLSQDIFQTVKGGHTGEDKGAFDRLFNPPQYGGPVVPGALYILADDVATSGGTLAVMARHIRAGGGRVVGAVTLAKAPFSKWTNSDSADLAIKPQTLDRLKQQFDMPQLERLLSDYGAAEKTAHLTNSQGQYLASFHSLDAFRKRIIAERIPRRGGGNASLVRGGPQDALGLGATGAGAGTVPRPGLAGPGLAGPGLRPGLAGPGDASGRLRGSPETGAVTPLGEDEDLKSVSALYGIHPRQVEKLREAAPYQQLDLLPAPEQPSGIPGRPASAGGTDLAGRRTRAVSLATFDPADLAAALAENPRLSSIHAESAPTGVPQFQIKGAVIRSPWDFVKTLLPLRSPYQETLKVAILNSKNKVVHSEIMYGGTLDTTQVDSRDFMRLAALHKHQGNRLLISHNHPSGDPTPSHGDLIVTDRLQNFAKDAGFEIVDHIITNGHTYYSFKSAQTHTIGNPELQPWENLSRGDLRLANHAGVFGGLAEALRQGNPKVAHVIFLNTRVRISAIYRSEPTMEAIWKNIHEGVGLEGAAAVLVDFGPTIQRDAASAMGNALKRRLVTGAKPTTTNFLDFAAEGVMSGVGEGLLASPEVEAQAAPGSIEDKEAPPWYSRLGRALESLPAGDKKPKTGQQWLGWIARMAQGQAIPTQGKGTWRGGIAAEEIAWSGLDTALKPGERYTKQQVLDCLKQGNVQVKEIAKGGEKVKSFYLGDLDDISYAFDDYDFAGQIEQYQEGDEDGRYNKPIITVFGKGGSYEILNGEGQPLRYHHHELFSTLEEAVDRAKQLALEINDTDNAQSKSEGENQTSWDRDDLRTPGGENYRELLFTLAPGATSGPYLDRDGPGYRWYVEGKPVSARYEGRDEALWHAPEGARQLAEAYKGSHWSEPNVLAHVRFDERTDASGKPVLFVDEFQSDWHRQGRGFGYQVPPDANPQKAKLFARLRAIGKKAKAIRAEWHKFGTPEEQQATKDRMERGQEAMRANHYGTPEYFSGVKEYEAAYEALKDLAPGYGRPPNPDLQALSDLDVAHQLASYDNINSLGNIPTEFHELAREASKVGQALADVVTPAPAHNAVPDAPFKNTWHQMAFRRMVRWAAEKGFDKVAWTTGAMQTERYNLAKRIDYLRASRLDDGRFEIHAYKDDNHLLTKQATAAELPELVGKDLAQKIVNQAGPWQAYSGLDLQIGGAGKNRLYDRMLVDYANKFGRKFGASVEQIEVSAGRGVRRDPNDPTRVDPENKTVLVHALPITPEMRRSAVSEGMPLFSPEVEHQQEFGFAAEAGADKATRTRAAELWQRLGTDSPFFKRWFGNSKAVDWQGKPVLMFHGTAAEDFSVFDRGVSCFTPDRKVASQYRVRAVFEGHDVELPEDAETAEHLGLDGIEAVAEQEGISLDGGRVIPAYLKVEKPLDLREVGTDFKPSTDWDYMHRLGLVPKAWDDMSRDERQEIRDDYRDAPLHKFLDTEGYDAIRAKGYDAVIFRDITLDGKAHESWAVFNPEQVKGADNQGTFDPKDPSFNHSPAVSAQDAPPEAPAPSGHTGGVPVSGIARAAQVKQQAQERQRRRSAS